MKTRWILPLTASALLSINAMAADRSLERPPTLSEPVAEQSATTRASKTKMSPTAKTAKPATRAEDRATKPQELTEAELEQARRDIAAAKKRGKNPAAWPKTKIEETVNNFNQVTEIKVTPMSTQIPYTMKREAPSPATDGPGDSSGTLSVPKFINFGF